MTEQTSIPYFIKSDCYQAGKNAFDSRLDTLLKGKVSQCLFVSLCFLGSLTANAQDNCTGAQVQALQLRLVPVPNPKNDGADDKPVALVGTTWPLNVARGEEITFALYTTSGSRVDAVAITTAGSRVDAVAIVKPVQDVLECLRKKAVTNAHLIPRLVLNGMPLGPGARLVNTHDWFRGVVTFELRTTPPTDSSESDVAIMAAYWNSVYRKAGWLGAAAQRAEIQIDEIGPVAKSADNVVKVSGTSGLRRTVALIAAVFISIMFLWALFSNQIFRDDSPDWIEKARIQDRILNSNLASLKAWLTKQATDLKLTPDPETLEKWPVNRPDPLALPDNDKLVSQAIKAYVRIRYNPAEPAAPDGQLATIGAVILGKDAFRVSYSLSRVQLGAWLMMTIAGGLSIWVVHGLLPTIPLTFLALLGISGTTRLLSGVVDNAKEHAAGAVSQGLLADLTAGTNGGGIHRYQALMINLLLLTTIAFDLFNNLAFPEIANSWLVLLTGSAGIYMATKQISESTGTSPVNPTTSSNTPPAR